MSRNNTGIKRTIDSFPAHDSKRPKKLSDSLSDTVIHAIAQNSSISLNEVKKLRKRRKY